MLRREPLRLAAGDRAVLAWWALAHAAFAVLVWAAAWLSGAPGVHQVHLEGWDAYLLRSIAQHGYTGTGSIANNEAFFPGYPVALAAVHLVVRSWLGSELLLSFVAGGIGLVGVGRLAGDGCAAGFLLAAPASVFLFVGYSESLFLALAVPAWLCAVRQKWAAAGLLAFGAAFTRPDGLFLITGLAVLAVQQPDRGRALARLSPALLAPAAYEAYLVLATGRVDAWMHAQQAGWGIRFAAPWTGARATWHEAFGHVYGNAASFSLQLELLAMVVGLAGTAVLFAKRRWAEAVYCSLLFGSLACTTHYLGVPRALLAAFPLYGLLARAAHRRPLIGKAYLVTGLPLAGVVALLYLSGLYAG